MFVSENKKISPDFISRAVIKWLPEDTFKFPLNAYQEQGSTAVYKSRCCITWQPNPKETSVFSRNLEFFRTFNHRAAYCTGISCGSTFAATFITLSARDLHSIHIIAATLLALASLTSVILFALFIRGEVHVQRCQNQLKNQSLV